MHIRTYTLNEFFTQFTGGAEVLCLQSHVLLSLRVKGWIFN